MSGGGDVLPKLKPLDADQSLILGTQEAQAQGKLREFEEN